MASSHRSDDDDTSGEGEKRDRPPEASAATAVETTGPPETDDDDEESSVTGFADVGNPTRDALQEGILGLLRPTVDTLDARVSATRAAQEELRTHICGLSADLEAISAATKESDVAARLEKGVEKLNQAKRRVVVVANLLQGAQDRLNKIHQNCVKETAKRRTLLEPSPASTPVVTADTDK